MFGRVKQTCFGSGDTVWIRRRRKVSRRKCLLSADLKEMRKPTLPESGQRAFQAEGKANAEPSWKGRVPRVKRIGQWGWSTVNRNTRVGDAREVMGLIDALSGSL